jgi:hypothetical protein
MELIASSSNTWIKSSAIGKSVGWTGLLNENSIMMPRKRISETYCPMNQRSAILTQGKVCADAL